MSRGVGDHQFTRQQTHDALEGTAFGLHLERVRQEVRSPEGRKRSGMRRAAKRAGNDWVNRALGELERLCREQPTVWAGDLRSRMDAPESPFAWATPWSMAKRRGWLGDVVKLEKATWEEAQAHMNPVYESTLYRRAA